MPLPESIIAGATGHVAHHNTLHALVNDNIANANIAAGAAIDGSKLDFDLTDAGDVDFASIADGDGLRWDDAAGKVKRSARREFNVKDFGAVGDNSADDTAEVQAAIDAAYTAGGGVVFFPLGTYKMTDQLVYKESVNLIGAGSRASAIKFTADLGAGVTGIVPTGTFSSDEAPLIEGLRILGPGQGVGLTMGTANADMDGIEACAKLQMRKVYVDGFRANIVIKNDHQTFWGVHSHNGHYNVYFASSASVKGNQAFFNCDFTGATFASIACHGDNGIDACQFWGGHAGFAPYGFYKESGTASFGLLTNTILHGFSMESIGNAAVLDDSSGAGQDTFHGAHIIQPGFSWSATYKIAARADDYAIDARVVIGSSITPGNYPFVTGDVAAFKMTGGDGFTIYDHLTVPTLHSSNLERLRFVSGRNTIVVTKALGTISTGDLLEGSSSGVQRYGTDSRAFYGVAASASTVNESVAVQISGTANVVASEAVSTGGAILVPDEADLVKVKNAPSTGNGGYAFGSSTAIPNKHGMVGFSSTAISGGASGAMHIAARANRTFVLPGAVTALPTAGATYRGQLLRVEGGSGVEDGLWVCEKNAANAYTWARLVKANGGGMETFHAHGATGTTETIDLSLGNIHTCTLDNNCTFTFSGATTGLACSFTLILTQDATGGRTVTWPASVDWPGGAAPTLSTGIGKVSMLTFLTTDAGTTWLGSAAGDDLR